MSIFTPVYIGKNTCIKAFIYGLIYPTKKTVKNNKTKNQKTLKPYSFFPCREELTGNPIYFPGREENATAQQQVNNQHLFRSPL